jgi:hypothetical protein
MTKKERESQLVMLVYEKDVDHYISRYMSQISRTNALEMYVASFLEETRDATNKFGHDNYKIQYMTVRENENYTTRFRAIFYTRGDMLGKQVQG